MYWNGTAEAGSCGTHGLIETWDVLKCRHKRGAGLFRSGLIETWDVLKSLPVLFHNIRLRLIETWDVLKLPLAGRNDRETTINRNMRCIEMPDNYGSRAWRVAINRNMRCIEMSVYARIYRCHFLINRNMRCIEILLHILCRMKFSLINRNMRCIEMKSDRWAGNGNRD